MHFSWGYTALAFASMLFSSARGASGLFDRDVSVDVCGEVDGPLEVTSLGKSRRVGFVKECLCISTIPQYVSGNLRLLGAAVALVGKANVIAELTTMVNNCGGRTQCHYPPHSMPSCKSGSPCFFTCKHGYSVYPAGSHPTKCVCSYPYTECNGKCGPFRGCPSAYHAKRDEGHAHKCPKGLTACSVFGRNSWECIDTQTDLESCGGCPYLNFPAEGTDCTAILGVSDVSCLGGHCVVHKCMPGYHIGAHQSECIEGGDSEILAAQYGLEHVPF